MLALLTCLLPVCSSSPRLWVICPNTNEPPGMMDQLASVGVEFDEFTIERIFTRLERYYRDTAGDSVPKGQAGASPSADSDSPEEVLARATAAAADNPQPPKSLSWLSRILPGKSYWAVEPIYVRNTPVRPWALSALLQGRDLTAGLFWLAGYEIRSPNMYRRPDPWTAKPTSQFLENTNERMHCSVRVRLALQGLGLNDNARWDAPALKGRWKLKRTKEKFDDPIPATVLTWEPQSQEAIAAVTGQSSPPVEANGGMTSGDAEAEYVQFKQTFLERAVREQQPLSTAEDDDGRYVWEYCGPESKAPPQRLIVEEPLGPYERQLLRLSGGSPNVYDYAAAASPSLL
jgi:hypothetical protein